MPLALYRKYRPKLLGDLVGQDEIVTTLKNAARLDKIYHAYLFYGARGTGKTTVARLLAKVLNCGTRATDQKLRDEGEPCNACFACDEIDKGRALDVIEIDAASNRGIDEMRNLKENINLAPIRYQKKVFIIDEAHMLTKEAWNALLKTLEEPPQHVCFILATTEREKIPPTISSRTQRFQFRKLPIMNIVEKLAKIAEAEKIKAPKEVLELIARASEGSMRDAESLLDQVIAFEGNDIETKNVASLIGQVGRRDVMNLAELILRSDTKGSLLYLAKLDGEGCNLVQLNKDLIHYLRRALAMKLNAGLAEIYKNELSSDELKTLEAHSALVKEKIHVNLIKSLIRAYGEMRYTPLAIAPMEVAIIENLNNN